MNLRDKETATADEEALDARIDAFIQARELEPTGDFTARTMARIRRESHDRAAPLFPWRTVGAGLGAGMAAVVLAAIAFQGPRLNRTQAAQSQGDPALMEIAALEEALEPAKVLLSEEELEALALLAEIELSGSETI